MCGFAGFLIDDSLNSVISSLGKDQKHQLLDSMGEAIKHRGPDDFSNWLSEDELCGFSHRRLSIVDLSASGQQPMTSQCKRYIIVYNGEVYNFRDIALQLKADNVVLKGGSDTEVILEAISLWGVDETLQKMHGMFAIALFDQQNQSLTFIRDRMGEKPLYVGSYKNQIIFASELKALQIIFSRQADFSSKTENGHSNLPKLDKQAIELYLRHGYIPAPYSVFQNIFKLPAANKVTIERQQRQLFINDPKIWLTAFQPYWSLNSSVNETIVADDKQVHLQETFEKSLEQVVEREMQADVPLGAFLSGGVDSSTIVAVMQNIAIKKNADPVKTFSIGFEQDQFNEAPFAASVAKHLGTEHYEKIVTVNDAQNVIPLLSKIYDEPFADSSQIPTFLVSQLAKSHVTVSLSGDGGDELFGGYERYAWAQAIWAKVSWMPVSARKIISRILGLLSFLNSSKSPQQIRKISAKIQRLSAMLSADSRQFFYRVLISANVNAENLILSTEGVSSDGQNKLCDQFAKLSFEEDHFLHQMMFIDMHHYLPDDILTKVDRASMAVSLESRVPLLDHLLVEQAWKMRNLTAENEKPSKQALRKILYQSVPKRLIERPKKGFAIPLAEWLITDLREWADNLLDFQLLKTQEVFDAEKVTKLWNDFKDGKRGSEHLLWSLLMFQSWYQHWYQ